MQVRGQRRFLLQFTVTTPSYDALIVQGDFNARIDSKNKGRERTTGKEGIGNIIDMAAGGMTFVKKTIL